MDNHLQCKSVPLTVLAMGVKFSANEQFFDTWSPEMAYVLGFVYADGSLERNEHMRGWYIRIGNTDLERIRAIRAILQSEHTVQATERPGTHKTYYVLRIGSKKMYESLGRRGVTPRKSLTARCPNVPKSLVGHFVRGYLDGDGCVFLEHGQNASGQKICKRLAVIFTSGSENFLHDLSKLISDCGIAEKPVYNNGGTYKLRYGSRDSISLFELLYHDIPDGLMMQRKYDMFQRYFAMHPKKMRANIKALGLKI